MGYKVYVNKSIKVFYDEDMEGSDLLITGFKGFGAVGYITTLHLVEKLNCKLAGYIVTKYMPEEVTPDNKNNLAAAFTIYSCSLSNHKAVIIVNHDVPLPQERTRFAETLVKWAKNIGVHEAVLVGGFDSRFKEGSEVLRWIATSHYQKQLEEPRMQQGLYVIGPLALVLLHAEILGLPAVAILPYAEASRPDPRAAAIAVKRIGELYGFEVGVEDLLEEARKIEEMINMLEKQQRETMMPSSERVYM